MSIYLIIGIVFAIVTIIFAIIAHKEKGITFAVGTILGIVIMVSLFATSIILPFSAKQNIVAFKALSLTVKVAAPIVGNEKFTDDVEKANEWLEKSKENLEKYTIFSKYYGTDLETLEPIVLE